MPVVANSLRIDLLRWIGSIQPHFAPGFVQEHITAFTRGVTHGTTASRLGGTQQTWEHTGTPQSYPSYKAGVAIGANCRVIRESSIVALLHAVRAIVGVLSTTSSLAFAKVGLGAVEDVAACLAVNCGLCSEKELGRLLTVYPEFAPTLLRGLPEFDRVACGGKRPAYALGYLLQRRWRIARASLCHSVIACANELYAMLDTAGIPEWAKKIVASVLFTPRSYRLYSGAEWSVEVLPDAPAGYTGDNQYPVVENLPLVPSGSGKSQEFLLLINAGAETVPLVSLPDSVKAHWIKQLVMLWCLSPRVRDDAYFATLEQLVRSPGGMDAVCEAILLLTQTTAARDFFDFSGGAVSLDDHWRSRHATLLRLYTHLPVWNAPGGATEKPLDSDVVLHAYACVALYNYIRAVQVLVTDFGTQALHAQLVAAGLWIDVNTIGFTRLMKPEPAWHQNHVTFGRWLEAKLVRDEKVGFYEWALAGALWNARRVELATDVYAAMLLHGCAMLIEDRPPHPRYATCNYVYSVGYMVTYRPSMVRFISDMVPAVPNIIGGTPPADFREAAEKHPFAKILDHAYVAEKHVDMSEPMRFLVANTIASELLPSLSGENPYLVAAILVRLAALCPLMCAVCYKRHMNTLDVVRVMERRALLFPRSYGTDQYPYGAHWPPVLIACLLAGRPLVARAIETLFDVNPMEMRAALLPLRLSDKGAEDAALLAAKDTRSQFCIDVDADTGAVTQRLSDAIDWMYSAIFDGLPMANSIVLARGQLLGDDLGEDADVEDESDDEDDEDRDEEEEEEEEGDEAAERKWQCQFTQLVRMYEAYASMDDSAHISSFMRVNNGAPDMYLIRAAVPLLARYVRHAAWMRGMMAIVCAKGKEVSSNGMAMQIHHHQRVCDAAHVWLHALSPRNPGSLSSHAEDLKTAPVVYHLRIHEAVAQIFQPVSKETPVDGKAGETKLELLPDLGGAVAVGPGEKGSVFDLSDVHFWHKDWATLGPHWYAPERLPRIQRLDTVLWQILQAQQAYYGSEIMKTTELMSGATLGQKRNYEYRAGSGGTILKLKKLMKEAKRILTTAMDAALPVDTSGARARPKRVAAVPAPAGVVIAM